MPSRLLYRRTSTKTRRRSSVVPGGQTKKVAKGSSRNAPIYAYQPARVALRKLIHFITFNPGLKVNSSSVIYPNANASFYSLNSCAQGDGLLNRSNNKIYMRNLNLSWGHGDTLSSSTTFQYSLAVVYDRESRGGSPSLTDIFASSAVLAAQQIMTRDRYDIVYRKTLTISPDFAWNGAVAYPFAGVSWNRCYGEVIPINRMATYSASISNDYLEILKGSLWLIVFNNYAIGAGNPNVYFNFQLEFVDVQ